jgi:ABC-type Na+ efflux pump permease subunit
MGGSEAPNPWLILVLVIAVAILLAVGSLWLANHALSDAGKEHNSTLSPFLTVVGLVYGALLGFTVVVA